MSKVQKQVEIESSGYDIVSHCAKLVAAVKAAGGFTAAAIPAEVGALVAELPGILSASQSAAGDLKEDKIEFFKGVNLAAYDMVAAIEGKPLA